MVTVLKNTTKLVTDVPFPALTFCGSGVRVNHVEKKLVKDFRIWRTMHMKINTSKEVIAKDMENFMEDEFQIKRSSTEGEPQIHILDILDMMISPDVDTSLAANGVRENEIACKEPTSSTNKNTECTYSCANPGFTLLGSRCFHVTQGSGSTHVGIAACTAFGAVLAIIENSEENALVSSLGGESLWIGLSRASSSPYASESVWAVGGAVPHFHPTEIGQRQRYEIITETTQMAMPKTLAMAKAYVYDNLIKKQMGNGG